MNVRTESKKPAFDYAVPADKFEGKYDCPMLNYNLPSFIGEYPDDDDSDFRIPRRCVLAPICGGFGDHCCCYQPFRIMNKLGLVWEEITEDGLVCLSVSRNKYYKFTEFFVFRHDCDLEQDEPIGTIQEFCEELSNDFKRWKEKRIKK